MPRVVKPGPLGLALAFAIVSCATPSTAPPKISKAETDAEVLQQRKLALQDSLAKTARIANIGFALERANAPLCPKTRPLYGFGSHNTASYGRKYAKAAMALYHFSGLPRISYIVANAPAQKAGLKAGDEITGLDGTALKDGKKGFAAFLKRLRAKKGKAVTLRVRRGGEVLDLPMTAVPVCDIAIGRSSSAAINARTYPNAILVNDGMLRFVHNDNELALVLAHELAHFSMGHVRAEGRNISAGFAAGLVLDVALFTAGIIVPAFFTQAGAGAAYAAYSADFEREADYVGAYYLVRAGFDPAPAEAFWRRMGAQYPGTIERRSSHPPTAKRFVAMRKTLAEIAQKQKDGIALIPDVKLGRKALRERAPAKHLPGEAL